MKTCYLPDVGEGLVEAEIATWLVAVGDTVAVNDPMVEIETAKSLVELPFPYAGRVTALLVAEGDIVPVGAPILTLDDGSDAAGAPETVTAAPAEPAAAAEAPVTGQIVVEPPAADQSAAGDTGAAAGALLVGYGTPTAAVSRRPRAGRLAVPGEQAEHVNSSYATDQPVSRPVDEVSAPEPVGGQSVPPPLPDPGEPAPPTVAGPGLRAKPQVRRLARDLGVDLADVTGTGPEGLVTALDVARAAAGLATMGSFAPASGLGAGRTGGVRHLPLRGVRRSMVQSMVESVKAPQASMWAEVDVTETVRLIEALKLRREFAGLRISPILVLARAVCLALGRNPEVNGSIDLERQQITIPDDVNLGIAAATARGLVVPNIKAANRLDLLRLAQALNGLVNAAREGTITPADCTGGTFTITNVGVFGIDGGTPILVPGESAVLCLGAFHRRPFVVGRGDDERMEIRSVATLTLTIDHRVLDGESGARFLNDVATILKDPGLALLF
nr:2-oxo acid dehydrogenase subunit E2 [Propionibacterium sp.]